MAAAQEQIRDLALEAQLRDLDSYAEIIDSIVIGYRPRHMQDEPCLPRHQQHHAEAAEFLRSVRSLIERAPGSNAYRILMSEARQRAQRGD